MVGWSEFVFSKAVCTQWCEEECEKTNTLHCPECGVILTEDFKFCPSCGSKLMNQKVLNEDNLQKQDSDKTNSDNDEKKLE